MRGQSKRGFNTEVAEGAENRRRGGEGRGDEGSASSSWGMVASHLLIVNSNLQLIRMTGCVRMRFGGSGEIQRSCWANGAWKSCGKGDDCDPVGAQGSRCGEWIRFKCPVTRLTRS